MRLTATGITHSIAQGLVLENVSLSVAEGEAVAVVGPSGSGKSTLLSILGGLVVPDEGSVVLDATDLRSLSSARRDRLRLERFGFVLQFGELLPELTALENVALPLKLAGERGATDAAHEIFVAVGLGGLERRSIDEISGGEAQRVAVARALVHRPAVVLADEPTGSLDRANRDTVLDLLLHHARRQGAAVVLVTHDLATAEQCDAIIALDSGRVVAA